MSKNTESYLRYLKTFLNNNKYNFNIEEVDDYIDVPLFEYLEKNNVSNNTFKVNKITEDLTLNPPDNNNLNSLYLNPLLEIHEDVSENFLSYRKGFIEENDLSLLNKDFYNKLNYLFKKKTHSKMEKSFLISYGQLTFDRNDKSYSFPVILQKISIEKKDDNIIVAYSDTPLINFGAIREIPNISVKSLNLIKEISTSLQDFLKEESEVKEIMLDTFDALQYTSCNNLNILSSTNIILTDKFLPIDTLINNTLRSNLSKDSALEKLLEGLNVSTDNYTFSNLEFYSISLKDKFTNLLKNDISFIEQRHNNDNVKFLLKAFSVIFEKHEKVAYVSADKTHLNKLLSNFSNLQKPPASGEKSEVSNKVSRVSSKFKRIKENLKAELKSFSDSNPYSLDTNKIESGFHKIKAPYKEFWQEGIDGSDDLRQAFDDLDNVLIEEFERFKWSIKVAELCKNNNEFSKWQDLLTYIENYFKYSETLEDCEDIKLEFKLSYKEYSLNVLDEILEHLETNKKIPSFGIGVKTSWRDFMREILVEGELPQTLDDFKIIEKQLKLNVSKENLIHLWNKLMPKIGAVKLENNEALFEKKLNSYYQPIKKSANWFNNIWRPFLISLISAGFIWQRFLTEFMNIYIEYGLIKTLIMGGIKELTKLINSRMLELNLREDLYDPNYNPEEFNFLNLDNYKSLLEKLNHEDEQSISQLLSKQKNSIEFFTLNETYENLITDGSSKYDLMIIDHAELLSMKSLILLAYCEQAIILGDNDFTYFTSSETFNNYDKVFNALLPKLDPSLFSGEKSFGQIINSLTSNKHTLISVNNLNPRINYLCNNIANNKTALSNKAQSLALYSGVNKLDLKNISDFALTLKNAFINKDLSKKLFVLYINTPEESFIKKLKSYIISEFNDLDIPDFFIVNDLSETKNYLSDYLIILDKDVDNLINKKELYNLSVNTKNQFAYITRDEKNLSLVDFIKDMSSIEIDNYKAARDMLFNKSIYALGNVKYVDVNIDLVIFSSEIIFLLKDNTIINNYLIELVNSFNCIVFHENDTKSIENYIRSLDSFNKNDVLSAFVRNFIDVSEKQERSIEKNIDDSEEDLEESTEDIFTRSYIVTEDREKSSQKPEKQPEDIQIEVEDLSNKPDDIVKTDKSFELENAESEEFLPSSKFNKSISLDDQKNSSLDNKLENFNFVKWLEDKDITFYDYRPEGGLWIADSAKTREELKELKEKGFSFSLSLRSEKLPNKINAWKLE